MTTSELLKSAESISEFSDAEKFVANVSTALKANSITKEDSRAILLIGFRNVLDAAKDAPLEGEKAIFKWILPACLEGSQVEGEPDLETYRMRELLAAWIDQYPDEDMVPLRARALGDVQSRLRSVAPIPAIWTASTIGLRTPELELELQRLAERNDRVGDAAIECLARLVPNNDIRKGIVQKVLRRLGTRQAHEFFSAISTIGDSRFIPALSRRLIAEKDAPSVISLLGRIADRSPLDRDLQRRIWHTFRRAMVLDEAALRRILFTGGGITLCNHSEIIPSLVRLLESAGTPLHLIHGRLKDCVRPIQLQGWSEVDKLRLKLLLSPSATAVTGNRTLSATVEDHNRHTAWDTGLAAGISDLTDWLTAAMVEISGPFEKSDALAFSACYRFDSWPEQVEQLVLEEFRLEDRGGTPISDRLAAVEFFFGVGTFNALRIVLDTGLTSQGAPLRSTAHVVSELAEWLAQSERELVVEQLLNACESRVIGNRRMLAIAGLESLADRHLIPPQALPRLARVAQDSSLPTYATAAAIWATSCHVEAALLPEYVAFLTEHIGEGATDLEIKFQSFQSLVRLGIWQEYEEAFLEVLGLIGPSGRLTPSEPERYQSWQALLLAQLAIRVPRKFLDATIAVIERAGADAVHAVLQVCARTHQSSPSVFDAVSNAAIARTLRIFTSSYLEVDTLALIARFAPDAFVHAQWEQVWESWMPEGRAAIAHAVEENAKSMSLEVAPRVRHILEALLSDSVYRVRRIAARTYSRIDIKNLSELCQLWSESGNSILRLRAAEIAQYLPPDDRLSLDNQFLRTLREDPEKRVRNAAADGIAALRNRVWATQLLESIRAASELEANEWVSECYRYGRALAAIGDDATLEDLRNLTSDPTTPPNVRNWLRSVEQALDEHWKEVMRNWPEPSLPWAGTLEEVQTDFTLDDRVLSFRLLLWRQRPADPRGVLSWGGSVVGAPGFELLRYFMGAATEPKSLRIKGRTDARIWISSVGTHGLVSFVGNGPYPELLAKAEPDDPGT